MEEQLQLVSIMMAFYHVDSNINISLKKERRGLNPSSKSSCDCGWDWVLSPLFYSLDKQGILQHTSNWGKVLSRPDSFQSSDLQNLRISPVV